jgi:hypothetical protein
VARRTQNKNRQRGRSAARTDPPGPTGDPPRVVIDATEFLDRTKGTLPEQIAGVDLEKLNRGLGFFFSYLRGASEVFYQSKYGGRHGAIMALNAAWRLVALFKQPSSENLFLPLLHLSTGARAALRGHAAGTVQRLVEAGLSLKDARTRVAKALNKLGVRPERGSGQTTARTVRTWCEEVAADVGRRTGAAIVYDGMFTDEERQKFSRLQSDQKRRAHALHSLVGFVRAHFPRAAKAELQKPT